MNPEGRDPEELIAFAEEFLRGQLRLLPTPPKGFDPLKADDRALEYFGLPPRPGETVAADTASVWSRMFTPTTQAGLTFLPVQFPKLTAAWVNDGYRLGGDRGPVPRVGGSRNETSRNWSGAVVTGRGQRFGQVFGSWVVPRADAPGGAIDDDYRCSTWIGIDGHRRHSFSMPQLGTTQVAVVSGGQVTRRYESWWQWWLRGLPIPPFPFDPALVVDEGHEIAASVTVLSSNAVRFVMVNRTTGEVARLERSAPTLTPLLPIHFALRGVAAEWIAERPMRLNSTALHPLADCGEVRFSGCVAMPASLPVPRMLSGSRLLRMMAARKSGPGSRRLTEAKRNPADPTRLSVVCRP